MQQALAYRTELSILRVLLACLQIQDYMQKIQSRLTELSQYHSKAVLPNFDEFSGEEQQVEVRPVAGPAHAVVSIRPVRGAWFEANVGDLPTVTMWFSHCADPGNAPCRC